MFNSLHTGFFHAFLSSADFFSKLTFGNNSFGPDLDPNCLPRLSADDSGRQGVNAYMRKELSYHIAWISPLSILGESRGGFSF